MAGWPGMVANSSGLGCLEVANLRYLSDCKKTGGQLSLVGWNSGTKISKKK